MKTLCNEDWLTSTNLLHKELNLLKVQDIFNLSLSKVVYLQRHGKLPDILDNYFISNHEKNNSSTRNANTLYIIKPKNKYGCHTLRYLGATLYNEISTELQECKSIHIFKKRVSKLLISKY